MGGTLVRETEVLRSGLEKELDAQCGKMSCFYTVPCQESFHVWFYFGCS